MSASIKARDTTSGKPLLHKYKSSLGRKCVLNYRSKVGMLSYLRVLTRPEISMAVHQCERFCNNPRLVHKCAIRRIANYLVSMSTYVYLLDGNWRLSTRGIFYRTNIEKGINFYVDSEFDGG